MKFGEEIAARSVPRWASYNVKYNELKYLIKQRTSAGSSLPISVPTAGSSRWQDLENELYPIINREYENVSLFLRTKQGEIGRRLAYLEKQVTAVLQVIALSSTTRVSSQPRKYQRLVKEGEAIGDEIECLSRFAAVQKTAFRKILKKYRKWTGSTALQERLERDVFSSGALQVDYAGYLQRLGKSTGVITTRLQEPMLTGQDPSRARRTRQRTLSQSNAPAINEISSRSVLHFDAALDEVPYGETGGSAYFWIHSEHLEQVETLLLRHMNLRDPGPSSRQSPASSTDDLSGSLKSTSDETHQVILDNTQRFIRDSNRTRPSRAAVIARWNSAANALFTLSSLSPRSEVTSPVSVKRKHVSGLIGRSYDQPGSLTASRRESEKVRDYLSEHRDVKPLASVHSTRLRYTGMNNKKDIGSWATLDCSMRFEAITEAAAVDTHGHESRGEAFPYAVLHVRWEFSKMPELVRVLETSNLAESVQKFSVESAAIHMTNTELERPAWMSLLTADIRRVPPLLTNKSSLKSRGKEPKMVVVYNSSGPSSAGGDSVFSATQGLSSATEVENDNELNTEVRASQAGASQAGEHGSRAKKFKLKNARKKKVKVQLPPPFEVEPQRYWNEFDDGDSDVNAGDDRYAIYVDPNEETFPGAETFSRVFGSMFDSLRQGRDRMVSWWPMSSKSGASANERTPLLFGSSSRKGSNDGSLESSGSDSEDMLVQPPYQRKQKGMFRSSYARNKKLSRRQKTVERTLFQAYVALIVVAYLLLGMAAVLLGTGRKKQRLEVDAGVVTGVVAAEACTGISIVLVCMRRQRLDPIHWGLVTVNIAVVAVIGVAELALMFGNISV